MKKQGNIAAADHPLELLEQATALLRQLPASIWLIHASGTALFVTATLRFLADMGRSADAADRLVPAAFGLAVAYALMKHCHALCGWAMLDRMQGGPGLVPQLGIGGHLRLFAGQILIHATMPWVMMLSLLAMLPTAWTYAAYHNASILAVDAVRRGDGVGALAHRSLQASHYAPRQNHAVTIAISVVALALGINMLACAVMLPQLLSTFTGSENALSLNPFSVFNTTVIGAVILLTWAAINPFARACQALRCFAHISQRQGDDLRAALRALPALLPLVLAALLALAPTAVAAPASAAPAPAIQNRFDDAVDDALARPEFRWRMPRERGAEEKHGWFGQMITDVSRWLGRVVENVFDAIVKFIRWLRGKPDAEILENPVDPASARSAAIARIATIVLLVIGGLVLAVLALRWWRTRGRLPVAAPVQLPQAVDLADESITADALPEDDWLRLAHEKWAGGERRLAVRALFLGTLARLGDSGLLAISAGKTNGIYGTELARQARAAVPLREAFRAITTTYEGAWYGEHAVDDDSFERFHTHFDIIRNHAGKT